MFWRKITMHTGIYNTARALLEGLNHVQIAQTTVQALAKPYSNPADLQKAMIDALWGIDGQPRENGLGVYNQVLLQYRATIQDAVARNLDELNAFYPAALAAKKVALKKQEVLTAQNEGREPNAIDESTIVKAVEL